MISRRLLTVLVFALPVLVVAFAIFLGMASLAFAMQDPIGGRCLQWAAAVALMLLIADVLLLVGILGWEALERTPGESSESPRGK